MESSPLRKRFSSVTRFAFTVIIILAILYLLSLILISVLTAISIVEASPENITTLISVISDYIHIDVAGAIGTIATAVIARYGVREFSANWKGKEYKDSETEKEELGQENGESIN